MGAGTGWTVNKGLPLINSIRCGKNSISSINCVFSKNSKDRRSAKMLNTMSQSAWHKKIINHTCHQRLNMELNSNNWKQWLVGMVDGDGCFTTSYQNKTWSLIFKLSLHKNNIQVLHKIKKWLGYGSISVEKNRNMVTYRIRDRKVLANIIFPIFDKYPLLSTKYFYYQRVKEIYQILENSCLTKEKRDELIFNLMKQKPSSNYISPIWNNIKYDNNQKIFNSYAAKSIMTKPWIVGFVEAEGSFYITKKGLKDEKRLVHGFGISQKLDKIILQAIRKILHIPTNIRYKEKYKYFILDTTNKRAIQNIAIYFENNLQSAKSLDFKIWKKAFNQIADTTGSDKYKKFLVLAKAQTRLRKLNKS